MGAGVFGRCEMTTQRTYILVDVDNRLRPGQCAWETAAEAIRAAKAWPEAYRVVQRETTETVIWVATDPDWSV